MEECCRVLEEAKDGPGDTNLLQLIRIQRLHDQATALTVYEPTNQNSDNTQYNRPLPSLISRNTMRNSPNDLRAPLSFHVRAIAASLDEMRSTLEKAGDLDTKDRAVLIALHSTTFALYETALFTSQRNMYDPLDSTVASAPGTLDYLYQTLHAMHVFISTHLTMPPSSYFNLPISYWARHGQVVITMARLFMETTHNGTASRFTAPTSGGTRVSSTSQMSWDKEQLREELDPFKALSAINERFEAAGREAGVRDNEIFLHFAKRVDLFTRWIEGKQLHGPLTSDASKSGNSGTFKSAGQAMPAQTVGAGGGDGGISVCGYGFGGNSNTSAQAGMNMGSATAGGMNMQGTASGMDAHIDWRVYDDLNSNFFGTGATDMLWSQLGLDGSHLTGAGWGDLGGYQYN
jgi:hypothetical protein